MFASRYRKIAICNELVYIGRYYKFINELTQTVEFYISYEYAYYA